MRAAVLDAPSQPVANLCRHPQATSVGYFGGPVTNVDRYANYGADSPAIVTAMTEGGIKFARFTRLADTGSGSVYQVAQVGSGAGGATVNALGAGSITTGERMTVLLRLRASVAAAAQTLSIVQSTGINELCPNFTWTPTTTWQWVRFKTTVVRDALQNHVLYSNFRWLPVDGWMDVAECMIVKGWYDGDYVDGSFPGWQWAGTAAASESAGYPYTLESIAGRPLADLTAPGTVGFSTPLTVGGPRSLYSVHTAPLGASTRTARILYTNPTFELGRSSAGPQFFSLVNASAAPLYSVTDDTAPTVLCGTVDATGFQTLSHISPSAPFTRLTKQGAAASISGGGTLTVPTGAPVVRALAYGQAHDDATSRRITAWLARRYGAPVPTGY